jgi:hypothetical protein
MIGIRMAEKNTCPKCATLRIERIARFTEYQEAKDALAMSRKGTAAYQQRKTDLRRAIGRLREANKQEDGHREHCSGTQI